jgi:hypothetical protein
MLAVLRYPVVEAINHLLLAGFGEVEAFVSKRGTEAVAAMAEREAWERRRLIVFRDSQNT